MALRETMERESRGELQGLIQIECTEEGEKISILGAFAERLQYGAMGLIKALGIVAEKIADSDGAGYTSSPSLREIVPRRKPGLHPALLETTEMAELEQPRRKRR